MSNTDNNQQPTLEQTIDALEPVVALLCLVQITGDRNLLHKYAPALEGTQRSQIEAFVAGVKDGQKQKVADPAIVAAIKADLLKRVKSNQKPQMTHLDMALFRDMSRLALGFDMPENSLAPSYQLCGFITDTRIREPEFTPPEDYKVLVIGAGMMGINAGIKLQQSGFEYTIIEAMNDVGGTWLVSTYPGAAVDTPSILYSYSYDPNPSWTRYYPTGPEFLTYLKGIVDRHNLRDRIHFNTAMQGAKWDEARQMWTVEAVQNGEKRVYEANALIIAVGPNNRAKMPPDVKNLDAFAGPIVHTAVWDNSVELKGKHVVQIGVGCSGVQLATAIADRVGSLDIVMRQPEYVIPNPLSKADVDPLDRRAQELIPFAAQWRRLQGFASSTMDMKGMMTIDPEWRAKGGRVSAFNDAMVDMSVGFLKSKFPDNPEMIELLTPKYPIFAKRPILDCGYYDTLKKDNVNLVVGSLAACEKDAIVLADGTRIKCDVLLLATGYHLDWCQQFDIVGRNGKTIRDAFNPSPYAYYGQMVPNFPNMFIMGGPNSHLVQNHAVVTEQHTHWLIELLQATVDENLASVDVTEAACRDYIAQNDKDIELSCWVNKGEAHGYYRHPGSGKVIIAVGRHNSEVWHETRVPKLDEFKKTPSGKPARQHPNPKGKLFI